MTFGSLFAGIGGFDLGLERTGMSCAWQVEIDPFCRKVLAKHWPDVQRFDDIRKVGKDELRTVDLICGGFPCQPFSHAGKRGGTTDDRHLWPEMLRVISELRPAWVLGENVPGIVNMALDDVLADLEDKGYSTQAFIIPACATNAQHRRDRVWIVAYAKKQHAEQPSVQSYNECKRESDEKERLGFWNEPCRRGAAASNTAREQAHVQCERPGESNRCAGQTVDTREEATQQTDGETSDNNVARLCEIVSNPESGDDRRNTAAVGQATTDSEKQNDGAILTSGCEDRSGQQWQAQPRVCRGIDGIPPTVEQAVEHHNARLKALGNAVVPQVVEAIGRIIYACDDL